MFEIFPGAEEQLLILSNTIAVFDDESCGFRNTIRVYLKDLLKRGAVTSEEYNSVYIDTVLHLSGDPAEHNIYCAGQQFFSTGVCWMSIFLKIARRNTVFVIISSSWINHHLGLFPNTSAGAQSSVVAYSLIETARENGLDPYRYLLCIFREAPKAAAADPDWAEYFLPQYDPTSI